MNKSLIMLSLVAMLSTTIMTACGGSSQEKLDIYPLDDYPTELSQSYEYPIGTDSIDERSNDYTLTNGNGADILNNYKAEFSYDNTNGSFYYYTNAYDSSSENGLQAFKKVMGNVESVLNFTESYQAYTLQPNSDNILEWKEESTILKDYLNSNLYTKDTGATFNDDESPLVMWIDDVTSKSEDDTFYMYMGDLDEQNSLLSECGDKFRDYLQENPTKDLLMFAFTMPFNGSVSYASLDIDGNMSKGEITQETNGEIDKNYYILALGDRDVLKLLEDKLSNKLQQVADETGLSYAGTYMYHDYVFTQTAQDVNFSLSDDDIVFNLLDSNEQPVDLQSIGNDVQQDTSNVDDELKSAKKSDAQEDTLLRNLSLDTNLDGVFSQSIDGEYYAFTNVQGDGKIGFSLNFGLDFPESDAYEISFDTEQAKIYEYQINNKKAENGEERQPYLWNEKSIGDDTSLTLSLQDDQISIERTKNLDISTPALVVSVPVKIVYDTTTTEYSNNLVPNSSNIIEDGLSKFTFDKVQEFNANDSSLGKTYRLDEFFSHLTIHDVSDSSTDIREVLNTEEQHVDTEIKRLNVIITYGNN